jgi:Tfp pilus assembly protein PilN
MRRMRFSSGLLIGLLLGVAAGVLIGLRFTPAGPPAPSPATLLQVEELTRRLEAAQEERARADKQLERFQQLSEQMTKTFNTLEARFKALEEAERSRQPADEQADGQPEAHPPGDAPGAPPATQ